MFNQKSIVLVLGVMYPSVLQQPGQTDTRLALVPPLLGAVAGRQSAEVVFDDPLSPSRNGDELPNIAKYWRNPRGDIHRDRVEAQKAVARDLSLLSEERRWYQPGSSPSVPDIKTPSNHPPLPKKPKRLHKATVV
jgi:hypothetical protein